MFRLYAPRKFGTSTWSGELKARFGRIECSQVRPTSLERKHMKAKYIRPRPSSLSQRVDEDEVKSDEICGFSFKHQIILLKAAIQTNGHSTPVDSARRVERNSTASITQGGARSLLESSSSKSLFNAAFFDDGHRILLLHWLFAGNVSMHIFLYVP